ncbi:Aerotolerance protein BatB [hydrothermal vent metagenome]|uniref:Aerotolerance protein BatB n=1 Tax=hydrothermal vent metagenome TaxID=652676 RepID=A0A3B1C1B3_9ZZZZ
MFRFAHIDYLNLLYLVPVLILIYWYSHRRKNVLLNNFANSKLHKLLFPLRSGLKGLIKFSMTITAIILLILALANPQVGSKIEEVKQVGIDVYILLDVSLSMEAQDIKPSRLEKAKHEISKLIHKLRGDRIGLIVFSGEAFVQFPLTTDYSAANLFLSAVDVATVPQPGTAIGPAIKLAIRSFKKDEDTKKAIIIITDGENHQGDVVKVAEEAADDGISIFTIGLGSATGAPIPIKNASGQQIGYKKDRYNNVVLTKLDENTLKEIANAANGKYYHGTNTEDELNKVYNDLSKFEKTEYGATRITDYEDRFYYLLLPAVLLLILEFFITSNKNKLFIKFDEMNK